MRHVLLASLIAAQQQLDDSRQVNNGLVRQLATRRRMRLLQQAIHDGWILEHQSQQLRERLYYVRRNRPHFYTPKIPVITDDCWVTLQHGRHQRTVKFSTTLPSNALDGTIGLDSSLGQQLIGSDLMSVISMPTPLGTKTYQIVEIRKQAVSPNNLSKDAITHSADSGTI